MTILGVTDLWSYVVATVLVILLPGPNSLYVLSVGARRGVRSGFRAAMGVLLGDTVLMIASAAGVASLLQTSPMLFGLIRYAGAAYLVYLGATLILSGIRSWRRHETAGPSTSQEISERERPFRRALVASLLNPKAIVFFVAFFVQFVDPAYPYPALSFLLLGAIVQLCSISYLTALIFSGSALAAAFHRRRRLASLGSGAVGVVMVVFAVRLSTGM